MIKLFKKPRKLLTALSLLTVVSSVNAVELMKWERMPLAVPLQVGQERVIFVDSNVRVGVPSSLSGKLRVQSTGGSVYLLALEPIPPTRIQLQDAETGGLILMDIAASTTEAGMPKLEPIQIIEGENTPIRYGNSPSKVQANAKETVGNQTKPAKRSLETPVPVVLTRYASQNLYAPLRTIEPVQGISRVNLSKDLKLITLLPMQPIKAQALVSWRLDDYFVTAVSLTNTSRQVISLDPRLLQGNFIAATFQHSLLGPKGDATDTTVVYLVTRQYGLAKSILPALSQINAAKNIGGRNEK